MKMKAVVKIMMLVITLFAISCHPKSEIAIVKNNTNSLIVVKLWGNNNMTDGDFKDKVYMDYWIPPGSYNVISTPGVRINTAPDFVKKQIYIFNNDTLDKYIELKKHDGIMKQSLLKKIQIQINKVKPPLDTIYINQ